MLPSRQNSSRLVLGTAQLGMNYGIANTKGQPDFSTARSIVQEAWGNGICEFDTAQAYGKSEQILGKVLKGLGIVDQARIITKLDPALDHLNEEILSKAFESSMENLGVKSIFGLMLHREDLLDLWEKGLGKILRNILDSGRVRYLGVSVYSPEKATQALLNKDISMIQLPTNILDRRFVDAGVFGLAMKKGKQLYIRSVFLQGLLLMDPEQLPVKMKHISRSVLEKFQSVAKKFDITRQELALGYVKMQFPEAKIIFGAERADQVNKNADYWNYDLPQKLIKWLRHAFESVDGKILNPALWPK